MIVLREKREGDVERFEDAIKDAKMGIKEACEIFEEMKEQFSERGSYGERYSRRGYGYSTRDDAGQGGAMGGGMYNRDWDDFDDREYRRMRERRGRDSMGRFR